MSDGTPKGAQWLRLILHRGEIPPNRVHFRSLETNMKTMALDGFTFGPGLLLDIIIIIIIYFTHYVFIYINTFKSL